jgi:hypothetical protein
MNCMRFIGGGFKSSLKENQGCSAFSIPTYMGYFPEWQDTVKGAHGGSYQVPLGGNTDNSVLLLDKKITSLMVRMMKIY